FSFEIPEGDLSYSLPSSPVQIDSTLAKLYEAFPDLVRLAEKENLLFHLSEELEKTRRRVNALEYVLIPDLGEVIRSIENKLSENERSNQTRLMKIKDMVKERAV
ncbi:MAG: V-type ATP synthase subunit D, partial [Planctomycetota bacterium]